MKWITEFHQKHKNQPIWIVGAGPSIDSYPDNFLDGKLGMTIHNGYLKFPDVTYRSANEADRVSWFKINRPEYFTKINIFAFPFYRRTQLASQEIIGNFDNPLYYFVVLRAQNPWHSKVDLVEKKVIEARNGTSIDHDGYGTCLHTAFYTAIMMGCNPINIIGCEHKAEKNKPEYYSLAHEASKGMFKRNHVLLGPRQEPATRNIIEACKRQGITVNRFMNYEDCLSNTSSSRPGRDS